MLLIKATAEYYSVVDTHVKLYYRDILPEDKTYLGYYYLINDKVYNTIYTNSLEDFENDMQEEYQIQERLKI